MSDYTKITDFAGKDLLTAGDPDKLVLGAELDAEFVAIAAAIGTKTDGNGSVSTGDKGDITVSAAGLTWTIDSGVVTLAKMADLATGKFIGRYTGSTGVPQAMTINDWTEDTTPDGTADFLMTYDASAATHKNVYVKNLSVGVPQNSQTVNYTIAATDNGKHIYHSSAAGAGDTYTIDSNANLALPIGFAVTFVNMAADSVSIAITTDTMNLGGAGTTGTRTLAQYGVATALKTGTTEWVITGTGLS